MDLKTRIEVLPCGMCEEMMGCDTCLYSKEAHDLYYQIRAEAIDECIAFVKDNDSGCGNEWAIAKELEQLKENK